MTSPSRLRWLRRSVPHLPRTCVLAACTAAALLLASAREAGAVAPVDYYFDRAFFEGVFPGLVGEDFEDGSLGGADAQSFAPPLDSATNNGVFAAGAIPPGVVFDVVGSGDLVLAGPGYTAFGWTGFPSQNLQPGTHDTDAIELRFPAGTYAVGLRVFGESDSVRIETTDQSAIVVGRLDINAPDAPRDTGKFVGIADEDPIVSVIVNAPSGGSTGAFEAIDDVVFLPAPSFARYRFRFADAGGAMEGTFSYRTGVGSGQTIGDTASLAVHSATGDLAPYLGVDWNGGTIFSAGNVVSVGRSDLDTFFQLAFTYSVDLMAPLPIGRFEPSGSVAYLADSPLVQGGTPTSVVELPEPGSLPGALAALPVLAALAARRPSSPRGDPSRRA